jgi:hypothetical protein
MPADETEFHDFLRLLGLGKLQQLIVLFLLNNPFPFTAYEISRKT